MCLTLRSFWLCVLHISRRRRVLLPLFIMRLWISLFEIQFAEPFHEWENVKTVFDFYTSAQLSHINISLLRLQTGMNFTKFSIFSTSLHLHPQIHRRQADICGWLWHVWLHPWPLRVWGDHSDYTYSHWKGQCILHRPTSHFENWSGSYYYSSEFVWYQSW